MKTLVVVDMQKDFVTGVLGTKEAQAIVPNVVKLVEKSRDKDVEVKFTLDTHYYDYMDTLEGKYLPVPHCILSEDGWSIIPELEDIMDKDNDMFFMKNTFGCLDLVDKLLDLDEEDYIKTDEIVLCGVCTDICVISNALLLRAYFPNTEITIVEDCCAGVTPQAHDASLIVAKSCQINVVKLDKVEF